MLIVSPDLCRDFPMINLHPAAPNGPDGTWQDVIWQLIEQRATHSGVKIHLVTEELDQGPTIAYCRYPIHGKAFDDLWQEADLASVDNLRQALRGRFGLIQGNKKRGCEKGIAPSSRDPGHPLPRRSPNHPRQPLPTPGPLTAKIEAVHRKSLTLTPSFPPPSGNPSSVRGRQGRSCCHISAEAEAHRIMKGGAYAPILPSFSGLTRESILRGRGRSC